MRNKIRLIAAAAVFAAVIIAKLIGGSASIKLSETAAALNGGGDMREVLAQIGKLTGGEGSVDEVVGSVVGGAAETVGGDVEGEETQGAVFAGYTFKQRGR